MSDYKDTNHVFRPVKCLESDLKFIDPAEGFVYFTTDTKKIFCVSHGKFLPMGGNSGIYYGSRTFAEDETNTGQTDFEFDVDTDIQGDQTPNLDDLILNIPDGGFYRVIELYGDSVLGRRLAVSGGGGGVGPGGGGGGQSPSVNYVDQQSNFYFVLNDTKNMKIGFSVSSPVDDGNNYISQVEYYYGNDILATEEDAYYHFNDIIYFDVSQYLNHFNQSGGVNTLNIAVTDVYGNMSQKRKFQFYLVNLNLTSDSAAIQKIDKDSNAGYTYRCKPTGGGALNELYIDLRLSELENPSQILWAKQEPVDKVNTAYTFNIDIKNIPEITHGVYLLTAQYCGHVPKKDEIIRSNQLSAQIAVWDSEVGDPLVATNFTGATIMQYTQFVMQYMIVDESTQPTVKPLIYYGDSYSEETATLNELNTWQRTFITPGIYELVIQYENAKYPLGNLTVETYVGDVPVINADSTEIYLTSMGKSNTQADRATWKSEGKKKDITTVFEDFLWGNENGWITNAKGETALKITNGAKLTIPDYHPFEKNATETGLTIELDFMFSGVLDYSKPLIHCLSTYEDGNGDTKIKTGFNITGQKATLNSDKFKATSTAIGGEEDENGKINETDMALQAFTQYFNEDTRIHLTYVIEYVPSDWSIIGGNDYYFVYTYLNGVLSGIMKLSVDPVNKTADSFQDQPGAPSFLTFDSTYGDIYVYNIRVYRNALDMRSVIDNYVADLTDIEEKVALYKDNNIFTTDGFINIKAIQDISYTCGVPYVLFNGGNPIQKKFKNSFAFKEEYALPVTKSDFRLMSMKMYSVNEDGKTFLDIDVPISAVNENDANDVATKFGDMKVGTSYLPKRGVQVYGQGTSSMVYPVKNLRLKFVQENDYPQVYEGAYPTEIVCFKADFMDSSSAHNTCTGNLVYDMYQALNMKTPPQKFKIDHAGQEGVATHDIVTAIKGFPIICFYAPGDSQDYEYIGRYNFNLDKATPEPFGFPPQCVYTGEVIQDDEGRARQVVEVCGLKTENVNGKQVLPLDAGGKEIERDIVQCWEVLNNDNDSPTKFLKLPDAATYEDCLSKDHAWLDYYEDRYPDAMKDGAKYELGDADAKEYKNLHEDLENGLFRVSRWINSTSTREGDPTGSRLSSPVYYQTMDTEWDPSKAYYTADGAQRPVTVTQVTKAENAGTSDDNKLNGVGVDHETFVAKVGDGNFDTYAFYYDGESWLLSGEIVNIDDYGINFTNSPSVGSGVSVSYMETNDWPSTLYEEYLTDSANYRLSKFKTEFTQYFDMEFSTFYYVMTLTLLMMDSRAKNMMLASWDQQIWYPIFYDMDTMLGVNNTGFNKFSFDTEDDPADKVFNGFDSVLWNNFRTCFPSQIANFYARLRGSLTLNKLLETYNEHGADAWNEALCSADAYYKYERPYEEGYFDGKDGIQINPGQISYLYAAQGKRSNHRAWWLSNRLNYLDSKYIPTTYGAEKPGQGNTFSFRAYALPEQKSTTKALDCVAIAPANHQFNLTALNNSYQSIFIGNIVYGPRYTLAGQTVTLGPSAVKHEVESYILNPTLISDLGDLSDKYIGSLNFPGVQTRLTSLKFGRSRRSHSIAVANSENLNNGVVVNNGAFIKKVQTVPFANHAFSYDGSDWKLNGVVVNNLSDYGISLTKVPVENDTITISYQDRYSAYYNSLLSGLNIGTSCPYLQEINFARCTGLADVNLTACTRLQVVDAEGCTNLTNINFPANSILQQVYVPDSLTSLTLTNQPHLTEIKFDNNPSNILDIRLDNVPSYDSYGLVKKIFSGNTVKKFYLTNVNWTVSERQEGMDIDDNLKSIDILEKLWSEKAQTSFSTLTKSQSLTGTLTINISGCKVNEYEIYSLYKTKFPNLTILYGPNIDKTHSVLAYDIKFMSEEDPAEAIEHYHVKAGQGKTLGFLTSKEGPNGEAMKTPNKPSSQAQNFRFTGYWIDQNGTYYYTDSVETPKAGSIKFDSYVPVTDLVLYPEYDPTPRSYPVKFYNWDGRVVKQSQETFDPDTGEMVTVWVENWYVEYGKKYDGPVTNFLERSDNNGLTNEYERYGFKGWSTMNYGTSNVSGPVYTDPTDLTVLGPVTLYPHFRPEDCRKVPTNLEYFQIINGELCLKPIYTASLAGKITIPDNTGVHVVGSLQNANKITHVFFLDGSTDYTAIGDHAFDQCTKLTNVYLPQTITKIGEYAFRGDVELVNVNMNEGITEIGQHAFDGCKKVEIEELPAALTVLGSNAFQNAGDGVKISKLPAGITALDSFTFSRCKNVKISELGSSTSDVGLKRIGVQCFVDAGTGDWGPILTTLVINKSIDTIENQAFTGYGGSALAEVLFQRMESGYNTTFASMGFSTSGVPAITEDYDKDGV